MCLEPNRAEKSAESKKQVSNDPSFSTKPYIKIVMGTVLIGLSILSPLPAAAQTAAQPVVSYTNDEKAQITITEQFKDLDGNTLLPEQIVENQITYPPTIPGYWLVPKESVWKTAYTDEISLFSFLGFADPEKGDPLIQVIDLLNENIKDATDIGQADFTFIYEKDLSVFEGKTLSVPIGAKVTIPELVENLKNVDGSEGDLNQVVAEKLSAITTEKAGLFPVTLSYYDQEHTKVMKTTAFLNVEADKSLIKGKNIKLAAGSKFDKNTVIDQVVNSDGTPGDPADVQIIGNVDTNQAGTYPLTLRYTDPLTAKTIETQVTVTIIPTVTSTPHTTVVTRFVDAETNQELSPSVTKTVDISEGIPEIPTPVNIQGMVPNTEYSTFERNNRRINVYDYIRQNGLGNNVYWKDVVQHLQTEVQVDKNVPNEIVVTYAYTQDKSHFSINNLVVDVASNVEKEQLIKEARDTEGYFIDEELVTTSLDGKSFTEYTPEQAGTYTISYSYHDQFSLQDIHTSSKLVVLPKSEQKNEAVQNKNETSESIKTTPVKTEESSDKESLSTTKPEESKLSVNKESKSTRPTVMNSKKTDNKQPQKIQEKNITDQAAGIDRDKSVENNKESSARKKQRKEEYKPEPKKQATSPSQGSPAPGGGATEASQLGDLMRGIAGTFVYSDRNPFEVDNWS
ncbi:bacterial group 3 Ig-like protein [Enterococcus faecalis 13-SD-W-01]|nr:bacterial group 3 Ig-like protein [Enterococcus faecalis 13-SD-W-01]